MVGFWQILLTDFHSDCTNLQFHQHWIKTFLSCIITSFLIRGIPELSHLSRVRWNLRVVAIWIYPFAKDVEQLFYVLIYLENSLKICSPLLLGHLFSWVFVFAFFIHPGYYSFIRCIYFFHLSMDIQFSHNHLFKMLVFIHCMFLTSLLNIRWLQLHELTFGSPPLIYISVFGPDPSIFITIVL